MGVIFSPEIACAITLFLQEAPSDGIQSCDAVALLYVKGYVSETCVVHLESVAPALPVQITETPLPFFKTGRLKKKKIKVIDSKEH